MKDLHPFIQIAALVQHTHAKHLPPAVATIYKRAITQLAFLLFDEDEWTMALEEPNACPGYIADLVLAWGLLQRVGVVEENKQRKRVQAAFKKSKSDKKIDRRIIDP